MNEGDRIVQVEFDEQSLSAAGPEAEHERRVAVYDLLQENTFHVEDVDRGPYVLNLSLVEQKLSLTITNEKGAPIKTIILSLMPLRRVLKDYFTICQNYHDAIRTAAPQQIEAIDMGRRGLHNEGSEVLIQRLKGKVTIDFDTARRLFTLICALHQRGSRV